MKLREILPDVTTDVLLKIRTPAGKSHVLLYAIAHEPKRLPPPEVVSERWQNIANLVENAFGPVDCIVASLNGKLIIEGTATHISWSGGSVPFVFVAEDDPIVQELLAPSAAN